MISLSDAQAVQALLRRHGFHFSKAMGQNFIVDDTVCPRMAQQCGADSSTGVLEIGPGIGVLTRELSAVALYLTLTEKGAEIYCAATVASQARRIWEEAQSMVDQDADLTSVFGYKVFPVPTLPTM